MSAATLRTSSRLPFAARLASTALALAALGPGRALGGDDGSACDLAWERGSLLDREGITAGTFSAAPANVKPPRDLRSGRYGSVQLDGSRRMTFVMDVAPGDERVWFDVDRDGDLDEETPVRWTRDALALVADTVVPVTLPGGGLPVPLGVRLSREAFEDTTAVRAISASHRWGAASIGGHLVQVAVEDGDHDLRFDGEGDDRVLLDLDENGEFDLRAGSPEVFAVGEVFRLAGRSYRARVDGPSARSVIFDPVAEQARMPGAGTAPPLSPAGCPEEPEATPFAELEAAFATARSTEKSTATLARIGRIGSTESTAFLAAVARADKRRDARVAAVRALGNPDALASAESQLEALANGTDQDVAVAAVAALHAAGSARRIEIYARLLLGKYEAVATAAARHLGEIDDPAARTAIARGVRSAELRTVRRADYAGARTASLGLPLSSLFDAATDGYAALAAQALTDLATLRHPRARRLALEAVQRKSTVLTHAALPVLAAAGDADCVERLWSVSGDEEYSAQALELLTRIGDGENVTLLLRETGSDDTASAVRACGVLARIRAPRIAPQLLERMRAEPPAELREALLRALGRHGEVRVLDVLQDLAEQGTRPERLFAFRQLGSPVLRGDPKIDALLRKSLTGSDAALRALAVDAVRESGAEHLLPEVVENLEHSSRRVRRAVALCLAALPRRESVAPLIAQLADEGHPWVREAIGQALFRLTGQNLYEETDAWKRWFADHGATFVVPAVPPVLRGTVAARPGGTFSLEKPTFYGIQIETESIVFVIDCSGSMSASAESIPLDANASETRLARAKRELLAAADGLEDGARVNVVYFESNVKKWHSRMQVLDKPTRAELARFVAKQQPEGATNLYEALQTALAIRGAETIVVLSDGAPTVGKYTDTSSILAQVADQNRRRQVQIHCVSLGGPSTLLSRLAEMHQGEYVQR